MGPIAQVLPGGGPPGLGPAGDEEYRSIESTRLPEQAQGWLDDRGLSQQVPAAQPHQVSPERDNARDLPKGR